MYREYYQFTSDPFRLTPDQRFVYRHPGFSEARAYMRHVLELEDGILVITGRSGTGKTTLIEDLSAELAAGDYRVATLVSTHLGDEDILRSVAYAFGLEPGKLDKATIIRELEIFLSKQPRALLVVDEAQNLPETALEEIRMLTNLRSQARPLLQVFLVGQEKLHERLHTPGLEQLHQRLMAAYELTPLDLEETFNYVLYRLDLAGWNGRPAFTRDAFILIHRFSQGLPRYICKICSRVLFHGSVEKLDQITSEHMAEVVKTIQSELLLPLNGSTPSRASEPIPDIQAIVDTAGEPIQQRIALTAEEESFVTGKPSVIDAAPKIPTDQASIESSRVQTATEAPIDVRPRVASLDRSPIERPRGTVAAIGGFALLLLFGAGAYRLGVTTTTKELSDTAQAAPASNAVPDSGDFYFNDYLLQTTVAPPQEIAETDKLQAKETGQPSPGSAVSTASMHAMSAASDTRSAKSIESPSTDNPITAAESIASDTSAVIPAESSEQAKATIDVRQTEVAETDEKIQQLLQLGAMALEAYHLTTPENDNARRYFSEVLALDPSNEKAKAGLQSIMVRYRALTEVMIQRDQYRLAELYIDRGLEVMPDTKLLDLREVVEERRLADLVQEVDPADDPPEESAGFFASLKRLFSGNSPTGADDE